MNRLPAAPIKSDYNWSRSTVIYNLKIIVWLRRLGADIPDNMDEMIHTATEPAPDLPYYQCCMSYIPETTGSGSLMLSSTSLRQRSRTSFPWLTPEYLSRIFWGPKVKKVITRPAFGRLTGVAHASLASELSHRRWYWTRRSVGEVTFLVM